MINLSCQDCYDTGEVSVNIQSQIIIRITVKLNDITKLFTLFVCYSDSPRETVVRVGSSFNDQGGYLHKVTQLVIHSDYVTSDHPDIGLLKV
jgi:hypothetical protein